MEDKQKEARLLRRQRRNHPAKLKFSGKMIISETEMTDLKNGDGVKMEHKDSCELQVKRDYYYRWEYIHLS
jgi:hypothetical protein